MQANKTQPTPDSVDEYFAGIANVSRRDDAIKLSAVIEKITKLKPVMWGSSIVGFGNYHYIYETGREGDTPAVGFSARAQALTIYGIHNGLNQENETLAKSLGPHTSGKGCLYIKKLDAVDMGTLEKMIANAFRDRNNS